MNAESEIRKLNHRDRVMAARIVEVQQAAYEIEAQIIGFDGIPARYETPDDVMALDLILLAVVEDEEPIAVLGYRRVEDLVDIDRLVVRTDRFRRGLARRLLSKLHERESDAARFEVSTGADNGPAAALYQAMGYRKAADIELPQGIVITRFVREP